MIMQDDLNLVTMKRGTEPHGMSLGISTGVIQTIQGESLAEDLKFPQ
jgi:hypothetical protein